MVQILCADISSIDEAEYRVLYTAASSSRKQKADRYRHYADAVRCLAGEVLLRRALTTVFGHWEGFSLSQTRRGKPYLKHQPDFHFSISHSGNQVVLAYGKTPVGVDIQQIREEKARPAVARRFFTPEEQDYLAQQDNYAAAFTQIWTGKESHLKYLGTGLSKSLTSFSVLSPEEGLHYFWANLAGYSLCLCTRETDYQIEIIDIKNAPA